MNRQHAIPVLIVVIGLVLLAVIGGSTLVALKFVSTTANSVDKLGDRLKPTVNTSEAFHVVLKEMKKTPKLVVATARIDADVIEQSNKFVFDIPLGETIVVLRALDNKVQYVINLDKLSEKNLDYDRVHRTLVIRVPSPKVDREFVDIQSNPEKVQVYTKAGWARLKAYSGRHLEDRARSRLRLKVLTAAKDEMYVSGAKHKGEQVIRDLVHKILGPVDPDIGIRVEYLVD